MASTAKAAAPKAIEAGDVVEVCPKKGDLPFIARVKVNPPGTEGPPAPGVPYVTKTGADVYPLPEMESVKVRDDLR